MPRPSAESKFLKTARARFKLAEDSGQAQRKRELEDLRFYAGDQWDADILASRQGQTIGSGSTVQTVPARPSLTINKTREPVRQVLNSERQSDLGIELIPADDWGEATGPIDHTEIELREGLVRRIQRDSEAADARTWAFARAAIAGTGYYLVMTRYAPGKSIDQEIYIERIYNQSTVLLDPSHEQPDGSDANWAFWGRDMLYDEFKAEFGDSKLAKTDVASDEQWRTLGDEAPGWFTFAKDMGTDGKEREGKNKSMRVMNYVYAETKPVTIYHLDDNTGCTKEELPAKLAEGRSVVLQDGQELTHTDAQRSITWCKITGNEKLEETQWPGHWLPVIKVVGEELQPYDKDRRVEGIVRPMRDPCKGNNYVISKFVERVGLTPIPPIIMAGGQDEGFEAEWDAINTRTLSRLHYNQKDQFGQPVGSPPFRADARAEIGDLAMGVQMFGQAIASTSVTPETALGNADPTVKSGKLAKMLLDQAERGNSNFLDNLVRSMRHEARVTNDLLYPIYNRPGRLARMMNGQGEMSSTIIGQPFVMEGQGKQARPRPVQIPGWEPGMPLPAGVKYYGLTPDADFNVAVKVGKNTATRNQQAAEVIGEVVSADPMQMTIMGDKFWKYLDVPDHEELEKRYKAVLDPRVLAVIDGGQAPIPPEVQQQLEMLKMQNAELQQLADKNVTDLKTTELKESAGLEKARLEIESRERIASEANQVKLTDIESKINLAVAQAMVQYQMQRESEMSQQQHEQGMAQMQAGADAQSAEQAQAHKLQQGAQQQAGALEQGEQGQQFALEQGDIGHQHALEQAEQQAALAPPPAAQ